MSLDTESKFPQGSQPRGSFALTVDLEDWYHGLTRTNVRPETWPQMTTRAQDATSYLLDILDTAGVKATFFVLGNLAESSPKLIRRISEMGHELGSHGYSHRPIWRMTSETFRQELSRTRDLIQDSTGVSIKGFRAPYFSIDQRCLWAFEILAEEGYLYDSSVFPLRTILYGFPGASRYPYSPVAGGQLMEYPVATIELAGITLPIAGGFYYRMLPYSLIHWALERITEPEFPVVLYMHPWELDLNQPRIPVSIRERITHFGGRNSLLGKIQRLCEDFELAPLRELHANWLLRSKYYGRATIS